MSLNHLLVPTDPISPLLNIGCNSLTTNTLNVNTFTTNNFTSTGLATLNNVNISGTTTAANINGQAITGTIVNGSSTIQIQGRSLQKPVLGAAFPTMAAINYAVPTMSFWYGGSTNNNSINSIILDYNLYLDCTISVEIRDITTFASPYTNPNTNAPLIANLTPINSPFNIFSSTLIPLTALPTTACLIGIYCYKTAGTQFANVFSATLNYV